LCHGELKILIGEFFKLASSCNVAVADVQLIDMHLALPLDRISGYLCTPPIDLARVSVANGISLTSTTLAAHTIHAFSHFASKEWTFDAVVVDISYILDHNSETATIVDFIQHTSTEPEHLYRDFGHSHVEYYQNTHHCNVICEGLSLQSAHFPADS